MNDNEELMLPADNDNETLLTADEADEAVRIAGDAIVQELIAELERWAHARGVEEPQVKRVANLFAMWLGAIRSRQPQTALQMLQAVRATATQIQ
jgi:hypothetical protein